MGRGGVSPSHFLYEMTFGEAAAFMRGMQMRERDEWERTRCIMWAAIMPHSRKKMEYKDVMKFAWDDNFVDTTKVDKGELERARERAKKIKL